MNPLLKVLKIEFREFCVGISLRYLNDIFISAGFALDETDSYENYAARRDLVESFYEKADWENPDTVQKLLQAIENALHVHFLETEQKEYLRKLCREAGFTVDDKTNKIGYEGNLISDLFLFQFPAGLPFGVPKPGFSIKAQKGGQKLQFELQSGMGVISFNAYPNLSYKKLEASYGLESSTNTVLKEALWRMNQTKSEKTFFRAYAQKFDIAKADVPILLPQAWIQWHSLPKRDLRSNSSLHSDDLYRVDFVAFWDYKRYAILVDDISHYAFKQDDRWFADQESYSKRLKEDRKLRKENWNVFRISNWELRNEEATQEILRDLHDFIGFEYE